MIRRILPRPFTRYLLVLLNLTLAACGGRGDATTAETRRINTADDVIALEHVTQHTPLAVHSSDIIDGIILTRLDLVISPRANAAEVNEALDNVQARIATSQEASPFMTVEVPHQGDAAVLDTLS